MPLTASAGQQAALQIQQGTTNLALVSGSQPAAVTQAAPIGAGIPITSQMLGITLIPTGTLDDAATVEVQAQINGVAFYPVFVNGTKLTFTGAQIKASAQGGLYFLLNIKANQIRFALLNQTTVGANGVTPRVMD